VLVSVALFTGACAGSSSAPSAGGSATPTPSTSTTSALPAYVVARLDVGNQPCAVEGGFGSVWVSVYTDNQLVRIDPATHRVIARTKTGTSPCGIAVGGGSVWVENFGGDSVTRVDPTTGQATTVNVGLQPYDVTYAAGAAWVTNFHDDTVTRIDAASGKTRTIKVGGDPTGIAPADGAVWVTNQADGTVSRIDPVSLRVQTKRVKDNPSWTSWGGGRLWIANGMSMLELDDKGRVVSRVDLAAPANDGDIVAGDVWVPDGGGSLHEIGPDGKARGAWPLQMTNPFVAAGWAGKLWVVDFKGTAVEEVDPAKLTR
jgi:YVTN family beta-propeller protein